MYQLKRKRSGKTAVDLVRKDKNESTAREVFQLAIVRPFIEFLTTSPFSKYTEVTCLRSQSWLLGAARLKPRGLDCRAHLGNTSALLPCPRS